MTTGRSGRLHGPDRAGLLGRLFDEHAAALVLYARQWSASRRRTSFRTRS